MLNMSTLYERLLEVCRDNGIERPIGRDIQSVSGLSSGRVTQIKQEREAARLGGDSLQRLTGMGYSANWLQEGRGPMRPTTTAPAVPEPSSVSPGPERPPVVPDAVWASLTPAVRALVETAVSSASRGELNDAQASALTQIIVSSPKKP